MSADAFVAAMASYFAPEGEAFGAVDVLVAMGVSCILACVMAWVYQRTRPEAHAEGFAQTLVLMAMTTAVVIMVVGPSVARAFTVFGAFALIRFRNALPQTRDIGFVFLAMVVGMAAGTQRPDIAALATAVACAVILLMDRLQLFAPRGARLLRVRFPASGEPAAALDGVLARHASRHTLIAADWAQGGAATEASYSIVLREGASVPTLLADIRAATGDDRVLLTRLPS